MPKVFWLDVETTGKNPTVNDIVQLAYAIEIDGDVKTSGVLKMQPFNYDAIEQEALDVNGLTLEEIRTYATPQEMHAHLTNGIMGHVVDRYNREDKFHPAGYNVGFDMLFVKSWFEKCRDPYCYSWFNNRRYDVIQLLYTLDARGLLALPNYQLATVCQHFGIPLEAHNPEADLLATRAIGARLECVVLEQ